MNECLLPEKVIFYIVCINAINPFVLLGSDEVELQQANDIHELLKETHRKPLCQ